MRLTSKNYDIPSDRPTVRGAFTDLAYLIIGIAATGAGLAVLLAIVATAVVCIGLLFYPIVIGGRTAFITMAVDAVVISIWYCSRGRT